MCTINPLISQLQLEKHEATDRTAGGTRDALQPDYRQRSRAEQDSDRGMCIVWVLFPE
ncbi:hypothetical protein E2C01_070482 [Portunus trituberculatus]|uniref:Uncharacterized protein n=1 Tax=Portunus trituberculatus TaxID=210409 RepID=A0A5B7I2E9_PORTR|nr:hypothetical protein [Portunus trituberculatus]